MVMPHWSHLGDYRESVRVSYIRDPLIRFKDSYRWVIIIKVAPANGDSTSYYIIQYLFFWVKTVNDNCAAV